MDSLKVYDNAADINCKKIPQNALDGLSRTFLKLIRKSFSDPAFRKGYEKWRAENGITD